MDKNQITDLLNLKKEQVYTIEQYFVNANTTEGVESFLSTISVASNYFSRIIDDLREDIVPQTFFQKIINNIQSINLDSIYSICKPNEGIYDVSILPQVKSLVQRTNISNVNNLYSTYIFFGIAN